MKPDERQQDTPRRVQPVMPPSPPPTARPPQVRPGARPPRAPQPQASPPDYDAKFRPQGSQMPMLPTKMRGPQQQPDPWLRGAPRVPQLPDLAPEPEPSVALPTQDEMLDAMLGELREHDLPSMVAGAESLFQKVFWGDQAPEDPTALRVLGQAALNMFWRWGAETMYQLPKALERIAYTAGKTGAVVNMPLGGTGTLSPYSAAMLASLASEVGDDALESMQAGAERYAATTPDEMRKYLKEGEIGYTFTMHPERLEPFRADVAAGMSTREAVAKYQDFGHEFWMNMLLDPAMFLPSEAMAIIWPGGVLVAKAAMKSPVPELSRLAAPGSSIDIGHALAKTIGKIPVLDWLTATSKRTLQRVKAGQASDAFMEIVMRMPGDEDAVVYVDKMLRGDATGFDILSEHTRTVVGELIEEFQDDGIASVGDLVTRYIPDLADGWSEDVVQAMIKDRPELIPYLVQESVSKRAAIELGLKPPSARGALARAFDFTSGVLKENWLTTSAYAVGNLQDNSVKCLLTDHLINPFDLAADVKVTRYMQDYGSYVPNVVMDGFVADELGLGGMSRTAQVPIPGIGKPAEIVDFWDGMLGMNLRAKYPWLEAAAPSRPGDLARAFDLAESPGRLAGVLDKANWASVVETGRGFSGGIERSARVQLFFDTFSKQVERNARPRLVSAASSAGLGSDVVKALGDASRVKSPRDIMQLTDMLTGEVQPVTRLSGLLPEGTSQEMLGRMARELDDLQVEAIARGTPEALDVLRKQAGELFESASSYARRMAEAGEFEEVLSAWRAEKMREVVADVLDRSRTLSDELLNMTKGEIAANPDRAGTYWARYFDAKPDIAQAVQGEVSRITRERSTTLAPDVDALLSRYQEVSAGAAVPALDYDDWGAFGETLAELRGQVDEPWRAMWTAFLDDPTVDRLDDVNLAYDATAGIWEDIANEATVWRDGYLAQMRRKAGANISREAYEEGMERIWRRGFDDVRDVWTDVATKLGGEVSDVKYVQGLEMYTVGLNEQARITGGRAIAMKPSPTSTLSEMTPGAAAIFDPTSGRLVVSDKSTSHFEIMEKIAGEPQGDIDWYWYDDEMKAKKAIRMLWDEIEGATQLVVDSSTGSAGYDEVALACQKLRESGVPGDMPVRSNLGEAQGYLVGESTLDELIAKAEAGPPGTSIRYWGTDDAGQLVEVKPSVLGAGDASVGVFDPATGSLSLSLDPKVAHESLARQAGMVEEAEGWGIVEGGIAGESGSNVVRIFQSGSLEGAVQIDPAARVRSDAIDDSVGALEAMIEAGYPESTVVVTTVGYPNNPAPGTMQEVVADLKALQGAAEAAPALQQYSRRLDTFESIENLADWNYGMGVYLQDEGRLVLGTQGMRHEDLVAKALNLDDPLDASFVRLGKDPNAIVVDIENARGEVMPEVIRALQEAGMPDSAMVMVPSRMGGVGVKTLGEWGATIGTEVAEQATSPGTAAMRRGEWTPQDVLKQYEQGPRSLVGGRWVEKLPETWKPDALDPMGRPGAYWGESAQYWKSQWQPPGWDPVQRLASETPRPTKAPPPSKARLDEWLRKGNINAKQYDEYLMQGQRGAQADFASDMGTEFSDRLRNGSSELLEQLDAWRGLVDENLAGAMETRAVEASEAAATRASMTALAAQWAEELQTASIQGAMETRRVLFDYTINQNWEEVLRYFVPFSKWQIRNPVIWAQIMHKKPWVFSAVNKFMKGSEYIRKERDLTQRFEGTVPVPQQAQGWLPQLGPGAAAPPGVPQQGYWAADPSSLFSLSGQFREPFISPGEEQLTGWKRSVSQAARVPGYLGMHAWPWIEYPMEQAGIMGDRPPWGMLGPVGRAVPGARRLEEDIAEARVPGSSWMRDYGVRRRIAEMQAEGTIDAQTAAQAQFNPEHPIYQQAVEEVNKISDFSSAWRTTVPYGLKYSAPGEMMIREQRENLRDMPEERAAFLRGQMPATRSYGRAIAATGSMEQAQWMAERDEINARYDAMLKGVAPWHPRATELNQARWAEQEELGPQPEPYTERGYEAEDRDSILFKLEQQRPRADQFAQEDGSIDWEAYNAAEADFLESVPVISEGLGIPVTKEDYERFRNRYKSPTELAWGMQQDRMAGGWDRYANLRSLRAPEQERPTPPPFGQEVGQVLDPSLSRREMLRDVPEEMLPWLESEVDRRLGAGWESSEVKRWLEGQGLPYKEIQGMLEGEGFGPREVGEYTSDVVSERPWLAGQDLGAKEWGDFGTMRSQVMPGMFTAQTDAEQARDNTVSWYYEMMPSQRDRVAAALRVPEGEEFSAWFDNLEPQGQQWAMEHADYMRSIDPLPTEGDRLNVELDMLRWSELGGDWTPLMDKYYGDEDSPRSAFWDYWYANKNYLGEGYKDDDVVQATLSRDVRSFLSPEAEDPLYQEALRRLEGFYDPEEAERWELYPELVEQAERERTAFYEEFDFDDKPADGEDREWWNGYTRYQKEHPVMTWFYWYDKYVGWWGDAKPGNASPIRPTAVPTPTPVPTPRPSKPKGGGGGGGGSVPGPPPPPPMPDLSSKGWLDDTRKGWLS